jgi:H+/Cl- antiporter ClcA
MVSATLLQDGQVSKWHMFLCYAFLNVVFVLLAALAVLYVGPSAASSGISDVKVIHIANRFPHRVVTLFNITIVILPSCI